MRLDEAPVTKNGKEGWKEVITAFSEKTDVPYDEARYYFYNFAECFAERILSKGRLTIPSVGTFRITILPEIKRGRRIQFATYVLRFRSCTAMRKKLLEAYKGRKFET